VVCNSQYDQHRNINHSEYLKKCVLGFCLQVKAFFFCELSYDAGDGTNDIENAGRKGAQGTLQINFNIEWMELQVTQDEGADLMHVPDRLWW
jgi:hypothetical protein